MFKKTLKTNDQKRFVSNIKKIIRRRKNYNNLLHLLLKELYLKANQKKFRKN